MPLHEAPLHHKSKAARRVEGLWNVVVKYREKKLTGLGRRNEELFGSQVSVTAYGPSKIYGLRLISPGTMQ